jgi:hypothetical protein
MSEPDGINERVTRLEGEVVRARQDAAAARVLAGGADRDVAAMHTELRAHTRSLNALRETQVDHGVRLARVEAEVREGFARVDTEMREGFSVLAVGQAQITALLTAQLGDSDGSAGDQEGSS